MRIDKVKRPGGIFAFDDVEHVADDEHGTWLFLPIGARWRAPHATGELHVDVLVLVADDRPFVTWWVDDPADRRVEIDVCLPAMRLDDGAGWTYVDLELDPVRHEATGAVEVQDGDELAEALERGWMPAADGELATAVATELAETLVRRHEPFGDVGWSRLARVLNARS